MSLRFGSEHYTDTEILTRGTAVSKEDLAEGTDLKRLELNEKDKQERLARIRADNAQKLALLKVQADLKKEKTEGLVKEVVGAGIQVAGAHGKAVAKKGQTLGGMKERLTELEGTPEIAAVGEVKAVPAVEGDIAGIGEESWWTLGTRGRKREKLTAEAAKLKAQIKFREENPEMAAYMQAYGRQG